MKNSEDNKRLIFLGAGAVFEEYYLPALSALGWLDRALVIDSSEAAIGRIRQRAPSLMVRSVAYNKFFRSYPLAQERDAKVVVALPNRLHSDAVERALKAGFGVLCEKPLALTAAECEALASMASRYRQELEIGMVRRYLPGVRAAAMAIDEGYIGRLSRVEMSHGGPYAWMSETGDFFDPRNGGVLADMGVHYLDVVFGLLGELELVSYQDDWRGGVEANCECSLTSKAGVSVQLILSRTRKIRSKIVIVGAEGRVTIREERPEVCEWERNNQSLLRNHICIEEEDGQYREIPALHRCFIKQLLDFECDRKSERRLPPRSGVDGAKVMRVIEQAYGGRALRHTKPAPADKGSQIQPSLSPGKAVITGGSGFIGGRLVRRLHQLKFDEIVAPVRNYNTCANLARYDVEMPRLDILDRQAVENAVLGARYVFHLAYGREGANAARVTIEGTKNVVNAAIEAGAEVVVVLSTMYVFGHPHTDELVDETWKYAPAGGEYGTSKAHMEKWCLRRASSSGRTRIVVLNPSCVYGIDGKTYTTMPFDLIRSRQFGLIENGTGIANYTYVESLVDAIILAARTAEAHGERFLISDGWCTWREYMHQLMTERASELKSFSRKELLIGPRTDKAKISDALRYLLGDLEFIGIVNRIPVIGRVKRLVFQRMPGVRSYLVRSRARDVTGPLVSVDAEKEVRPPIWVADLFGPTHTRFSADKARKVLGWTPRWTLQEGMEATRAWLKDTGVI